MKKATALLLLFFGFLWLLSCEKIKGTGEMEDDLRNVGAFDGISVSMDCIVYIQEPDSAMKANNLNYRVKIHAQGDLMRYIEANTMGGILYISFSEDKILAGHEPVTITVMAPGCSHISISTPGTVSLQVAIRDTMPFLECKNDGPGSIILKGVKYTYGEFRNRGKGSIFSTYPGSVTTLDVLNSGSGNIDLLSTIAGSVTAENDGSGSVSVTVTEQLKDIIKGSGNIYYNGDSATIESTHAGTGKLIRL